MAHAEDPAHVILRILMANAPDAIPAFLQKDTLAALVALVTGLSPDIVDGAVQQDPEVVRTLAVVNRTLSTAPGSPPVEDSDMDGAAGDLFRATQAATTKAVMELVARLITGAFNAFQPSPDRPVPRHREPDGQEGPRGLPAGPG